MQTYQKALNTIRTLKQEYPLIDLTCTGKEGHGLLRARVHYEQKNLVAGVLYRHDLVKDGKEGEPFTQYLANFAREQIEPWSHIGGGVGNGLKVIPMAINAEDNLFLTESRKVGAGLLGMFQENGFDHAYVRHKQVQGQGILLEVVVIVDTEDEFGIYEITVVYYIKPDSIKLRESLLAIHKRERGLKAAPTPEAVEAVKELAEKGQ